MAVQVSADLKRVRECKRVIENLNGIPAHRGTVEQIRRLEKFARRRLLRNSVKVPQKWVTVKTYRKSLQVKKSN